MVESTSSQQRQSGLRQAILFELDNIGVSGRKVAFEALKDALAEKGIELSIGLFAKHCIATPPALAIPAILKEVGNKRLSPDKIVAAFETRLKADLTDGGSASAVVMDILARARAENKAVGAISMLDVDTARVLAEKVGLENVETSLLANSVEDRNYPSADSWLKLARGLSVPPELCLAITTSAGSCRAALSAGMRCVAVPDGFTAFQDFSGADCVAEGLDESAASAIFALLAAE